jgi:tRNA U34 5-methylaminomethyl-2-thiouridine-forming methyltransferase MnmC
VKDKTSVSVLEVGLGTGLNVLLTYLAGRKLKIDYTVVEAYPLKEEEYSAINYPQSLGEDSQEVLSAIHRCAWEAPQRLSDDFTLTKCLHTFEDWQTEKKFDVVYYDAFSAGKQPELWTPEIFKKVGSWCNPKAAFVTYSVNGSVRRGLQAAGFQVEKIPGPPGGKRQILQAFYQG